MIQIHGLGKEEPAVRATANPGSHSPVPDQIFPIAHPEQRNLRLFVLFRTLYNCRFYYPVYAILFLDFGLDLAQFAVLNFVWAIAITVFEVPSGALADRFGRKPLVVASAILFVIEIAILCVAPVGGAVFWFFLCNRICSGMSEACASGADEALAYDSIPEEGRADRWASFLPGAMRWVSVGFLVTPVVGAFVYDAEAVNRLLGAIGIDREVVSAQTLRFPLYLNLATALGTLWVALRFRETLVRPEAEQCEPLTAGLARAFRETVRTGGWILRHRVVLGVILFVLLAETFIRLTYTVTSNYYRLIGIPDGQVGWISAAVTLVGIGTTFLFAPMAARLRIRINFAITAALLFVGLLALAHTLPGWLGVACLFPALLAIRFSIFFSSREINAATDSSRRATVLSFRGLAVNLGYGLVNLVYGAVWLRIRGGPEEGAGSAAEDMPAFERSLDWIPWAYLGLLIAGILVFRVMRRLSSAA